MTSDADAVLGPVPLPGLDPDRHYVVRLRHELDDPNRSGPRGSVPALVNRPEGLVLPGRALASSGVALPLLQPAQGLLLDVRAVDGR
ncbi:MAG: hypothetical protein ABIV05_04180 [Actinomycetota bacterium]